MDMICLGDKNHSCFEIINGIHTYPIQMGDYSEKSPLAYLKSLFSFFIKSLYICTKLHIQKRYDVIHFHNIPDFGVFCTLISKLMGAKVILDVHDLVPEFYMRKFSVSENHIIITLLKWIEKISASYADHVITVTGIWRERLIERSVRSSKCTVILNAPYTELFKKQKAVKSKNGFFQLSYHGNLKEPTGVDILIKALGIVRETVPSVRLQIIGGKGPQQQVLKKLTKDLMLDQNIRFISSTPTDKIPELIGQADVGIDPKKDGVYAGETLSVKAMEYLAMGVPLIVSKTKVAQTYFDESMVMFFNPGDENDLAKKITQLYQSPQKRKEMVKKAEQFNVKYTWKKYEKVYFELLKNLSLDNVGLKYDC